MHVPFKKELNRVKLVLRRELIGYVELCGYYRAVYSWCVWYQRGEVGFEYRFMGWRSHNKPPGFITLKDMQPNMPA